MAATTTIAPSEEAIINVAAIREQAAQFVSFSSQITL